MVLKKVLKQARRDSRPQVRICVRTPFAREAPDLVRALLYVFGDLYNRLPPRV